MPGYTRRQLKEDKFAEAAAETVSWAVEHRNLLITSIVIVVLAGGAVAGIWSYFQYRDQAASVAFGKGVRTLEAPVRPPDAPQQPGVESYTSTEARAHAAYNEFAPVAKNYAHTHSADLATYMMGVCAGQYGDYAEAERRLNESEQHAGNEVASMAKFALAGVYREEDKNDQALKLYDELMKHPTTSVPKATVELSLAGLYETENQPQQATKIYQQIQKDSPDSAAASYAQERLGALNH